MRLRSDLVAIFSILMRGKGGAGSNPLCHMYDKEMAGAESGEFYGGIRESFFTQSMVEHWNRHLSAVAMASNLTELKSSDPWWVS